jgi:hypothetical protein
MIWQTKPPRTSGRHAKQKFLSVYYQPQCRNLNPAMNLKRALNLLHNVSDAKKSILVSSPAVPALLSLYYKYIITV